MSSLADFGGVSEHFLSDRFIERRDMRSASVMVWAVLAWAGWMCGIGAVDAAVPAADKPVRVLFLGDSGHHKPVERLRDVGPVMTQRGIHLYYTDDMTELNPANLARYDALMVYANIDKISDDQAAAVLDYVAGGGAFVPVHCASYCFRNSDEMVKLTGGQFKSHGTGVFRTKIVAPDHPVMRGFAGFESWDETYVHHKHNEENRTVLEKREDEPYTWVRTHGKGRVFYTAWGHDHRTWTNPGFADLLERGIRWAVGQEVPEVLSQRPVLAPFEYVPKQVVYYPPGGSRGGDGEWTQMQLPLKPSEAIKHLIVPGGMSVSLFASEPAIYKPIAITWDERGRMWVAETVDYPNNLQPEGQGNDRISIHEDTNGDGVADKSTVFADKLSIPTSLVHANGGLIVSAAPNMLFFKDTDGDDKADVRQVLFSGWDTGDTHAGPNNLVYGFDNWVWGMVGYAGFDGEVGGEKHRFRMGFYRFKPDGSKLEFIRSTNNNTWGIGFSEDGLVFGSTANNNPSVYMPIAARYYQRVHGMDAVTLGGIADTARFIPITPKVRQVDVHWGYTAAAGHALYTARAFPQEYWNRIAFVTDGTGKLAGSFTIDRVGADLRSHNPANIIASDDEWFAPVMAEVGPDGAVWIADWYNFIFQHNPTPKNHSRGKGNAYETDQRDKVHGRIYRITYDQAPAYKPISLASASPAQLVATLKNDNLLWRRHAQRLLVERKNLDVVPDLIAVVGDTSVDAIGLNPGAIHALWTLHGLGALDGSNASAMAAAVGALKHPSAGVRRNALQVLPPVAESVKAILAANVLSDADGQVRLAALLALADMPADPAAGMAVHAMVQKKELVGDEYLTDAASIAASVHASGFMAALAASQHAAHGGHGAGDHAGHAAAMKLNVNLLPNPSFEDVTGNMPTGWTVRNYSGKAEHGTAEVGKTGKRSLHIRSTEGADTSAYAQVDVTPRTRYRLSAWIKTKDIVSSAGGLGALLNVHEIQPEKTPAIKATANWKKVQTFFTTKDETQISINCLLGGWGQSTGEAWYDDVELVAVAADTPQETVAARVAAHVAAQTGSAAPAASDEAVDVTIDLGVLPNVLRYDKEKLTVKAGQKVKIVFRNTDHMQHNFLLLTPGSTDKVGLAADAMIADPTAMARHFVPDMPEVLVHSPLVNPDQVVNLIFTAPDKPGEYPYICTFPGHWRIMRGVLTVEPR
jgi:putative membrane-bound dehydrogenase-like protein